MDIAEDVEPTCQELVGFRSGGPMAEHLGAHRRLLYKWRDQLDPMEESEGSLLHHSRVATLRKEVSQLKRVLADKVVEVDFFRGALHKVEARRQGKGSSGEKAPTTKSGR